MTTPIVQQSTPQQQYYRGFDLRVDEFLRGVDVDLSTLSHHERRGYDAACRAEADAETQAWLARQAELAAHYAEVSEAQDSRDACDYGWLS